LYNGFHGMLYNGFHGYIMVFMHVTFSHVTFSVNRLYNGFHGHIMVSLGLHNGFNMVYVTVIMTHNAHYISVNGLHDGYIMIIY
ncbi:hypothetical protein L9F63_019564, partial [Diploptera punctata]